MRGYIYILHSQNCKRPYLGSTANLLLREREHNKGTTRSTRNKGPWKLFWFKEFVDLSDAKEMERKIKKAKIKLTPENLERFVAQFSSKAPACPVGRVDRSPPLAEV